MPLLLAAILWCAPEEPVAPMSCVTDYCTVDYECAKAAGQWACHCCESTPGKQQARVEVCYDGQPPKGCK